MSISLYYCTTNVDARLRLYSITKKEFALLAMSYEMLSVKARAHKYCFCLQCKVARNAHNKHFLLPAASPGAEKGS